MNKKRQNTNGKKLLMTIAASTVLLGAIFSFSFGDQMSAFAAKPQPVIEWSNGFPSGEHSTMNIHGKKAGFDCDNSLEGIELYGSSVFVPLYGTSEINIVSNKRSDLTQGKAIDPCAAPFGQPGNDDDPALYQLPTGEHQVYWRILGKPNNGNGGGPSEALITSPTLIDQCNFLPVAYQDGSIVQSFDPDAQVPLALVDFGALEKHTDDGDGFFQNTESIYFDTDNSGTVNAGDVLLYGPVVADDTPLIGFNALEKHEDNTGLTDDVFESEETIYFDADDSDTVTQDDTRIANASSQGLSEDDGGDAVNCEDETLVGLGLVNNQGAFKKTDQGLERFADDSAKGKGKSKAVEITDLFLWTGAVCDASILDTWDLVDDNVLDIKDFDADSSGAIEAQDLVDLGLAVDLAEADTIITAAEDAVPDDASTPSNDDGEINNESEFAAFLENEFGETFSCVAFYDEWVFNVADIVLYGFDYENNGTTLSQMRFYPTDTTEFVE